MSAGLFLVREVVVDELCGGFRRHIFRHWCKIYCRIIAMVSILSSRKIARKIGKNIPVFTVP